MSLTISEAVRLHGLEYLRGKPIDAGGGPPLYICDRDLDSAIALWADEPHNAHLHRRFYGSEVRNDTKRCLWIYSSYTLKEEEYAAAPL